MSANDDGSPGTSDQTAYDMLRDVKRYLINGNQIVLASHCNYCIKLIRKLTKESRLHQAEIAAAYTQGWTDAKTEKRLDPRDRGVGIRSGMAEPENQK